MKRAEKPSRYNDEIPFWYKSNLTIEEAAKYFNIGENKLREMTDEPDCKFVLYNGRKRLIKRKQFEEYLEYEVSI